MRKLSRKQASSSGMCLQEDLNNVPLKWAEPPKTCPSDRTAVAIKECKKHKPEGAIGGPFSYGTADGSNTNLVRRQSRLTREEAVAQYTAEIHANPYTNPGYLVTEV